jgi:transcriptional regulator GlxA family with amidase domain
MKTVGILVFDDVEIATFADTAALFSAAHHPANSQPLFRTVLIAHTTRSITCANGFRLQAQATICDHPSLDFLLIPGGRGRCGFWPESRIADLLEVLVTPEGKGLRRERHNRMLVNWIRDQSLRVEKVVGICSGTVLLAESGLLNGYHATTHPSLARWMRAHYPQVLLRLENPLLDAGRIITAAGWKSAFEVGLHLIASAYGGSTALAAALRLDPHGSWLDSIGGTSGFAARFVGIEFRVLRYSTSR